MDLLLVDLQDESACYARLLQALHPEGISCPSCQAHQGLYVHRRHRAPVLDYRCTSCGRVFNAWTGTALQGTHRRPSEIVVILRGIAEGISTAQIARQLGCQRSHLIQLRHRLEQHASGWLRCHTHANGDPREPHTRLQGSSEEPAAGWQSRRGPTATPPTGSAETSARVGL